MSRRTHKPVGGNIIAFPRIPRRVRIGAGRTVSATAEAHLLHLAGHSLEFMENDKHAVCEACPMVALFRQIIAERKGASPR